MDPAGDDHLQNAFLVRDIAEPPADARRHRNGVEEAEFHPFGAVVVPIDLEASLHHGEGLVGLEMGVQRRAGAGRADRMGHGDAAGAGDRRGRIDRRIQALIQADDAHQLPRPDDVGGLDGNAGVLLGLQRLQFVVPGDPLLHLGARNLDGAHVFPLR